jgi:hypothetical protein
MEHVMFRMSIREALLLMLVTALVLGWYCDRRQMRLEIEQLKEECLLLQLDNSRVIPGRRRSLLGPFLNIPPVGEK